MPGEDLHGPPFSGKGEGMEGRGYCPRCGRGYREEDSFCSACGTFLRGSRRAATEVQGSAGGEAEEGGSALRPRPEVGTWVAAGAGAAVRRDRRRLAVALGVTGAVMLAAGAAVLVLYLAVWRAGGNGSGDPVSVVRRYMRALEEKDVVSLTDCFAEEGMSAEGEGFLEGLGLDPRRLLEMAIHFMEVSFRNVGLELEYERGGRAAVVTTGGNMTVSVLGMEARTDLGEEPLRFELYRRGGRWYLARDPLSGLSEFLLGEQGEGTDTEGLDLPESWEDLPGWEDHGGGDRLPGLEELWREMREWLEEGEEEEPTPEMTT